MKFSESLIPTIKETPAEAEVISHRLMLRAGFIRKLAAGIYTYLPLGLRVIRKVESIIRREMTAAGAEELLLPIIMPAELWEETGRWQFYGKELLRFKDRSDRDFCIGPTHEEAITDLMRSEIKSYRELPLNLFQIQTKFRDEIRPRFGLMRGREFIMKDAYSFDRDVESSKISYEKMYDTYNRIFSDCGLEFRAVEAATGAIGGTMSHEFQVIADSGEDAIFFCDKCDYAASFELARTVSKKDLDKLNKNLSMKSKKGKYKEIDTPGKKSVDEITKFLQTSPDDLIKTLIYKITDKDSSVYIAALIRGSDELVETKLIKLVSNLDVIKSTNIRLELANDSDINEITGADVGFAGPVGLPDNVIKVADSAIINDKPFIAGANQTDKHLVNLYWQDCDVDYVGDIRRAREGDECFGVTCKKGRLKERRGIEVGQVFYLGDKYSKTMNATYLDKDGKEKLMIMGCYGIGVGRTAAAAIEQNHDERGIIWPLPISPFHIHLIEIANKNEDVKKFVSELYCKLIDSGIEVLYDDRDVRAGVKFADADLIGIPFQAIIGSKALADNKIEVKKRSDGKVARLEVDDLIEKIKGEIANARTKKARSQRTSDSCD